MGSNKLEKARVFVARSVLPESIMLRAKRDDQSDAVREAFATSKKQAAVIGSEIVGFVEGVTPARRQAIVNSSLLAQLVAKKQVPDIDQVDAWYSVYFDVLSHIGWVVQDQGFAVYKETSDDFSAHKAILKVAALLLGPTPAALALVTTTLEALRSMNESEPWITLFRRETQSGEMARFQVSLVSKGEGDAFRVTLMAFGLKAESAITQVLFFKAKSSTVTFRHRSGEVTIDSEVLDGVQDSIRIKLAGITREYVQALKI